jgi:phosphoribosylformylglycinamidine cyclo-ligase
MSEHYKEAGVDIDAGAQAVALMQAAIQESYTAQVLAGVGSFGGVFALDNLPAQPVLVASIDGVGTKVKLAAELGRWRSIGHDLVNHCVNDILVQNARPLFFLDYVAASKLNPVAAAETVAGIAEACRAAGCALLGGETAEMPGVYAEGAFDLAGAIVGIGSRASLLPMPETMEAGDALIGLASSGPHTNGYSLIRKIVAGRDLTEKLVDGQYLADALLAPHRCYLPQIEAIQRGGYLIKGMAHITGGGLLDNVPRILPEGLAARIVVRSWTRPPVFEHLLTWCDIDLSEAHRVFNMGIGMVVIVPAAASEPILDLLPDAVVIGRLVERKEDGEAVQLIV